eukprot:352836-Chlamydomonas_euryale.AAC.9
MPYEFATRATPYMSPRDATVGQPRVRSQPRLSAGCACHASAWPRTFAITSSLDIGRLGWLAIVQVMSPTSASEPCPRLAVGRHVANLLPSAHSSLVPADQQLSLRESRCRGVARAKKQRERRNQTTHGRAREIESPGHGEFCLPRQIAHAGCSSCKGDAGGDNAAATATATATVTATATAAAAAATTVAAATVATAAAVSEAISPPAAAAAATAAAAARA